MFGDNIIKQLQGISVLNANISRETGDVAENILHQVFWELRENRFYFSLVR